MATKPIAVAIVLGLVFSVGCDPHPHGEPKGSTPSTDATASTSYDPEMASVCQEACAAQIEFKEADVIAQPGAKGGDLTRCKVSGIVFVVDGDRPKVDHAGSSYYLCCDGCARRFRAEPERFIRS